MLLLVVEKLGRQVFIENNIVSQQSIKNSVPSCSNGTRVECFYEITSGDNRSRVYSWFFKKKRKKYLLANVEIEI